MTILDVNVEERGDGVVIVALGGELDISEVARVEQELQRVELEGARVLVLDLSKLTFMDSSGLRLVLETDIRARREGRRFSVVPGPEPVHRVFLIALLDKRLDFIDDPSEATS